jgi:selenocysteine-specific elongation factor
MEMEAAVQDALAQGLIVELPGGELLDAVVCQALLRQFEDIVRAYHLANPLRLGMPREEVRSRLGLRNAVFNALLEMQTAVVAAGDTLLRAADHHIQFDGGQAAAVAALREKLTETPYTPPSFTEAAALVGEDVLYALIDLKEIVQIQPDIILTQPIYAEMLDAVLEIIDENGSITAAQMRDRFNTTRKYAIGLLEHLDTIGITRRVGDARVRGHRSR